MSEIKDDDEAYLIIPQEHKKVIANPETVWAKIGDDGQLEVLRWDIIDMYATEFDSLLRAGKDKPQTHVLCKLLVLAREQVKKEVEHEYRSKE
jgi:hypothetical protein